MSIHSVIVADEQPAFRRVVRAVIESSSRFRVVCESSNGQEALQLIRRNEPALALLDIALPDITGFDVITAARRLPAPPLFAMVAMFDEHAYVAHAFALGARGYLLKEHAEDEILQCLQAMVAGQHYLGRGLDRVGEIADRTRRQSSGS